VTLRLPLAVLAVALALNGCAGGSLASSASGARGSALPAVVGPATTSSAGRFKHIVLMIQENRSFNDFFATFPGADGTTSGEMKVLVSGKYVDQTVQLKEVNLGYPCDLGHSRRGFLTDYDGGQMDGFDLEGNSCSSQKAGTQPYQYVNPAEITPYWEIAQQYVLADHMFQTQGSGSFTAHQDLIAGGTSINGYESVVDFPTAIPWGCDAPHGTTAPLLEVIYSEVPPYMYFKSIRKGPFPCYSYPTLRDLLDAKSITWKYYSPPAQVGSAGALWSAFDAIKVVRYGPEWVTNVTKNEKLIFKDIADRKLPQFSWVVPDARNSDHPGNGMSDTGPDWIANVVNAIGESPYWKSTAIIVVWDDWGGFYDSVPPPFFDSYGGLGFRVPMLVISPYTARGSSGGGYISHTQYEFGSILKFVENNWNLGQLGTTDTRATSIIDCFDFTQQPHKFKPIPVNFSRAYFEHQRPSYVPVDTE
jgi:phospholipase C